ncbi:TPA: 2-nitropropane dioxygenase [Candidatus Taylorbacteria bacterium]|nr:2-nitropropane dioxygenase [Candidatus Taylorbacteria bacterium]
MNTISLPPQIVQGGMGFNISGWLLSRTVSMAGQRGTISGVSLERLLARLLQKGDPGGHMRRALSHFPFPQVVEKIWETYYVEGGIPKGTPFKSVAMFTVKPSDSLISLVVCANFAFVWLAKEGHKNPVSINYLEKLAMPHVYAITGAMLAGVDFITMGAGIPLQIPELMDNLVADNTASYRVPIIGTNLTSHMMSFNPEQFFGGKLPPLQRPGFIPIIASNLLASIFTKKLPEGSVQGFVIEESTAGGHNAPPRKIVCNEQGEPQPIYGEKDVVDYHKIAELGLPFWIGGSYASPEKLKWALSIGANGIQVGSIFALCEESGMEPELRRKIRELGYTGALKVRTDMRISPTGFPFKVATIEDTLSEKSVRDGRIRICNHGALVSLYEKPDGTVGYRCASEPEDIFVAKGGNIKDTVGRGCICNGLMSTTGLGDIGEPPVVTLGDDLTFLPHVMADAQSSYSAADAIRYLLAGT